MPDPQLAEMIDASPKPALSATSDMPVIEEAPAEPVDETAKPADTEGTATEAAAEEAGEADTQPHGETQEGGEEQDQTSPQQRAAFARERNRRQALEARLAAIEQQNGELIKALSTLQPKAEPPKAEPRPQRLDFDSPDAFETALEAWKEKEVKARTEAEIRQQVQREQAQARAQAAQATFSEREAVFSADHPDYMDITRDETLKVTPIMAEAAYQIEEGPEVLYHLAQNPDLAERLSNMTATAQVAEIGKLAARLTAPKEPVQPKPKPEPIRPIGGRSGEVERSADEMSMDEYHAMRAAQRKAAGIRVF